MQTTQAAQRLREAMHEYETTAQAALLQLLLAVNRHRQDSRLRQATDHLRTAHARLLGQLGRLVNQLPFCGSTFVELPPHLQRPNDSRLLAAEQAESQNIARSLAGRSRRTRPVFSLTDLKREQTR